MRDLWEDRDNALTEIARGRKRLEEIEAEIERRRVSQNGGEPEQEETPAVTAPT